MKAQLLLPLTVSFILNVFFLTQGLAAQQNGAQVDVAAVYQKALPGIKKIRKFLKAENTFDARIYRRLRNGLKKGNYTLVSNILKHIENAGGNKVDAEVEKLRTLLGKNGVALFQNTQGGGDNLVAKKPVSIHWTGYVGGNRAKIGQIPALSAPTLNPATASASYAATPSTVCTVDAKTGVLAIVGVGNCKITLTATPSDSSTHTVTKASLIVTIDSGTQTISSSNPYGNGASALVIGESLALQSAPTGGVTTLEYQTTSSGVCTVGANSGDVTADTTGSCVVQARWTASSDYNASPWTTIHTFTVSKKNQSAVTVANPYGQNPSVKVDATLAIATAPAGGYGTLEYQSGDTGACTVNASGAVTGVSTVGTCTIRARFAGNNAYASTPWANIATIAVNAKEVTPTPVTVSWRGYAGGNEARVGQTAPALRAPVLSPPAARASYSAAPAKVCSIESATGKLNVHGAGICRIALTATDGQTSAMANITVLVHKGEQSAPAAKGLYGTDPWCQHRCHACGECGPFRRAWTFGIPVDHFPFVYGGCRQWRSQWKCVGKLSDSGALDGRCQLPRFTLGQHILHCRHQKTATNASTHRRFPPGSAKFLYRRILPWRSNRYKTRDEKSRHGNCQLQSVFFVKLDHLRFSRTDRCRGKCRRPHYFDLSGKYTRDVVGNVKHYRRGKNGGGQD